MDIATIGLDPAKNIVQLHALDRTGETVLRKRLRRADVLSFFARQARRPASQNAADSWREIDTDAY
ncbi:hypothetical protein [Paraburkholderia sp. GAS334]|jgi:hypothetical protein|uniref:hypothetical protein n=1 Tax=Paraburkholderia sp. GAS334 TaxID=3035131 RepID=UPI003D22E569